MEKRPYHSMKRQRQAEGTRQRILASARQLLANRGYARMTLEELAELVTELVNPDSFDAHIQLLLNQLRTIQEPMRGWYLSYR